MNQGLEVKWKKSRITGDLIINVTDGIKIPGYFLNKVALFSLVPAKGFSVFQ